jgi:hypothetical protein
MVSPMAIATETFTRQIATMRSPRRAEMCVRTNASTIAKKMSGTASALSRRMTSRPSSPRCRLVTWKRIGRSPKSTPSSAPSATPIRMRT